MVVVGLGQKVGVLEVVLEPFESFDEMTGKLR